MVIHKALASLYKLHIRQRKKWRMIFDLSESTFNALADAYERLEKSHKEVKKDNQKRKNEIDKLKKENINLKNGGTK